MKYVTLGRTGLSVSRTSFGALPIQRVSFDTAAEILRAAYDGGINFYDTARLYSDSEKKIAYSLKDVRKNIVIASKSQSGDADTLKQDLETSLTHLETDYIDIYQLHNPKSIPGDDIMAVLSDMKSSGMIRHIGITNHSVDLARKAVETGLFETLQYPFSSLSSEPELELVKLCGKLNVGYIAMKAMAGGLITHVRENFAFIRRFENVIPIWGIQRMSELIEFLALESEEPELTPEMEKLIDEDKRVLGDSFCRSCGYCKPCPAEIPLENVCRMDMLLGRAVYQNFITPEWREYMARVENCTGCGACDSRCPYGLNPQQLSKRQYENYKQFVKNL